MCRCRVAIKLDDAASPVDAAYREVLEGFAHQLEQAGTTVVRDRLPSIDSEAYFTLYLKLLGAALSFGATDEEVTALRAAVAQAPPIAQRVAGIRFGGMDLSHREWLGLGNERRIARRIFDAFFDDCDLILTPVCAGPAFPKNEQGMRFTRYIDVNGAPQLEMLELFWSGYSGVIGLPSVVGPIGMVDHLPVGYQAIAGHGRDQTALAFTQCVEREIRGFLPPPLVR